MACQYRGSKNWIDIVNLLQLHQEVFQSFPTELKMLDHGGNGQKVSESPRTPFRYPVSVIRRQQTYRKVKLLKIITCHLSVGFRACFEQFLELDNQLCLCISFGKLFKGSWIRSLALMAIHLQSRHGNEWDEIIKNVNKLQLTHSDVPFSYRHAQT